MPNCGFNFDRVKTRLKDLCLSAFYDYNVSNVPNTITSQEYKILKELSKRKEILFLQPDKGRGVVVLDKTDYDNKLQKILSDPTKFRKIEANIYKHTIKWEDAIRRVLLKMKKSGQLSESETLYSELAPEGSRPGILYGVPKFH